MTDLKWLDRYSGQSIDELLSLEGEYRIDSLVLALEQALDQKAARKGEESLSEVERVVPAVEALVREVNNGGYGQFFMNTPEFASTIVNHLRRINCPKTIEITKRALDALALPNLAVDSINAAMAQENEDRNIELNRCDDSFYGAKEDIDALLFAFVKANKNAISL